MWAEVDVTTSMGLVSRLKTIPELFGNLKLFSKTMEEGLSGLDWLDNFQLRSSRNRIKIKMESGILVLQSKSLVLPPYYN